MSASISRRSRSAFVCRAGAPLAKTPEGGSARAQLRTARPPHRRTARDDAEGGRARGAEAHQPPAIRSMDKTICPFWIIRRVDAGNLQPPIHMPEPCRHHPTRNNRSCQHLDTARQDHIR
jgi:hypothetical protein